MTFKLNMSDEVEKAVDFEFPPTGKYTCIISNIELTEVKKAGPNFGKPLWKLTLTVEDGAYAGRTIPTTVSLYEANEWSLLSLKQLVEAVHPEYIDGKNITLPSVENGMPDPDPWIGQLVGVKGTKFAAGTKRGNTSDTREYDEFKVKYFPIKSDSKAGTGLPMPS